MKPSYTPFALTCLSSCLLTNAFPLLPQNLLKRAPAPQSYSVVPVDGGSSATASATRTVTNLLTQTQTALTTILSTIVITESETPVTIVVTATSPTTITQIQTVTSSALSIATEPPAIETVTVSLQPSVTSSPYDDGQWKTTYYSKWTISPVTIPEAVVSTSPTTSLPTASSSSSMTTSSTSSTIVSIVSSSASTPTDWATYYGQALATPVNGTWWGKK